MTIEDLKTKIDNLKALKAEWFRVTEEIDSTCDRERHAFLRNEEVPRLMNTIYDASLNLQDAFKATLGIYPSELDKIAGNFGYSSNRKYPCRAHAL